MDISDLTLKLIILLIPGALASIIIQKITVHKPWSDFQFSVNSILLGVTSYLLLQAFYILSTNLESLYYSGTLLAEIKSLKVWQGIQEKGKIPYIEVFFSSISAIIVSFFISWVDYNKTINNFAKRYGISNKYGDEGLYSYFLNSNEIKEVYVRSMRHKLTYHGYIDTFSETDYIKELTLRDVTVYSYPESDEMYNLNYIYLSLCKDDVVIEYLSPEYNEEAPEQIKDNEPSNGR